MFLKFILNIYSINANLKKMVIIRNRFILITIIKIRGFVNKAGYFRILIPHYNEKTGLLSNYCNGPKNQFITLFPKA